MIHIVDNKPAQTLFIPLDQDWKNRTLNATTITSEAQGFTKQALLINELNHTVYSFGGEISADGNMKDSRATSFYTDKQPYMWAMDFANDAASRYWTKVVGKNTGNDMAPQFQQPAGGVSTYDKQRAYYAGGQISYWSTLNMSDKSARFTPSGMLTFDFETQHLDNTTNDGDFLASNFTGSAGSYLLPGPMIVPPFGGRTIITSFGGLVGPNATENQHGAGWSNVWIFDTAKNASYYQPTTGAVPSSSLDPTKFTFFYAQDNELETFEM